MSYWDTTTGRVVSHLDEPWPDYPGWVRVDCVCCNGLAWGGEYPRECSYCEGAGQYAKHVASGMLAEYPGGRAMGREPAHA